MAEPGLPDSFAASEVQQLVVPGMAALELVEAQVVQQFAKLTDVARQHGHEESSDTTIVIEEGMNRLELHVCERSNIARHLLG